MKKQVTLAAVYFLLSTLITWWFIVAGKTLYISNEKMIISCGIAGAKWSIQIIAAFFCLKDKKSLFINRIGFTCFVGSCILLPYCLFDFLRQIDKSFLFSLIASVFTMILLYYKAVVQTGISIKWFWGWIICLTIAISLQLFVVFKVF